MMKFIRELMAKRRRKKLLKETNYGRKEGWIVKYKDDIVMELINPEYFEMFWVRYQVVQWNKNAKIDLTNELNWGEEGLKFISKALNENCDSAIIRVDEENPNFVIARGLYIEK